MGWVAIVTALIQLLGPTILAWLEKLLNKSAADLPEPDAFPSRGAAALAVIDRAIEKSRGRPFRRVVLRFLKRNAVRGGGIAKSLSPEATAELKELAAVDE